MGKSNLSEKFIENTSTKVFTCWMYERKVVKEGTGKYTNYEPKVCIYKHGCERELGIYVIPKIDEYVVSKIREARRGGLLGADRAGTW